jgi:hypothetical protein
VTWRRTPKWQQVPQYENLKRALNAVNDAAGNGLNDTSQMQVLSDKLAQCCDRLKETADVKDVRWETNRGGGGRSVIQIDYYEEDGTEATFTLR